MKVAFVGNFLVDYTSEIHHAKTLQSLGHEVVQLQEGIATVDDIFLQGQDADLIIWVHTHGWQTPGRVDHLLHWFKHLNIPTASYHLDLWFGLNRQTDLDSDPIYKNIGHFFTVDKLMADWFNTETVVRGHYLPAGVYEPECYMAEPNKQIFEIVFTGSRNYHPEWQYRPQLIDWLASNYGDRFRHFGNDGVRVVRGDQLNQVYADAKIVVGDSLCLNFDYPYYWSDRVFEVIGRGGFIIHPYIKGMEDYFVDGQHLVFYEFGNFDDLRDKIDYYLAHDNERETIRRQGFDYVRKHQTYTNRWHQILNTLRLS